MGRWCRHENWQKCPTQPPAILGLHSEWIDNLIIGSQRPSERLIKEFNIIEQFKNKGVAAIINL
jgi:predicted acetyltransferase